MLKVVEGLNKKLAVTPFPIKGAEIKVKNGIGSIQQKLELVELTVVFGGTVDGVKLVPGDTVFVRGETQVHAFAKEEYEVDGAKCILLDTALVVMCRTTKPDWDAPPDTDSLPWTP